MTRSEAKDAAPGSTLSSAELERTDAYWRAANYLSVGQIYLFDNPLLKVPLSEAHIKPRLLGHWGTTPGLNFIYVHLNRVIKKYDLSALFVAGPGHGGPALVANTYLEGTYTEVYPEILLMPDAVSSQRHDVQPIEQAFEEAAAFDQRPQWHRRH